jgi:hypothetical protein
MDNQYNVEITKVNYIPRVLTEKEIKARLMLRNKLYGVIEKELGRNHHIPVMKDSDIDKATADIVSRLMDIDLIDNREAIN